MAQLQVSRSRSRQPEVITGHRSPATSLARLGMATSDGREPQAVPGTIPGVVSTDINMRHLETPTPVSQRTRWRFRSRISNLTVLLGAWPDKFDTHGRKLPGRVDHARFRDGYYETENAQHAQILLQSPGCRLGGDFWDADHEDHLISTSQYDNFKASLRSNPELARRFAKDLLASDFDDIIDAAAVAENQEVTAGLTREGEETGREDADEVMESREDLEDAAE